MFQFYTNGIRIFHSERKRILNIVIQAYRYLLFRTIIYYTLIVYILLSIIYYIYDLRCNLRSHIANTSKMHSTRDCEWAQWKTVRGTKGNGEKLRWRFLWTETKAEMHPPTQFSSYPFHFHSIASTTSLPLRTSRYLVTSRLYIWDNFYRRYRSLPFFYFTFVRCWN